MLRKTIVALGLAAAAAENCGGALSMDPRYCVGSPDGVNTYCNSVSIKYEEIVPLRLRTTNNANFENQAADTVYVPGKLQGGKTIQIVFACIGGTECATASDTAVVYNPKSSGWECPEPANCGYSHDEVPGWTFEMGPCGEGFAGVKMDPCYGEGADKKCGCITLPPQDTVIGPDQTLTFGMIYMNTRFEDGARYYDGDSFTVHVSADEGMLETTGKICLPNELTASGTGTAQASWLTPPPPPPPSPPPPPPPPPPLTPSPPPSPPPPPPRLAACVCVGGKNGPYCASYGKCHWCDEPIPENACWFQGADKPCVKTCAEIDDTTDFVPTEGHVAKWLFAKRWGACSSACPVSASKDPHLHLPHGGRADFRGKDDTVFNLLSAKDVAFNVLFEKGDFAWATRLVHGTKMGAGYWVIKTSSGKTLNVEYAAEKFEPVALVHEDEHRDVAVRQGTPALVVDDVVVSMVGKTLTVRTSKWLFTATTSAYPFGKLEMNKNKVLLDVSVQPLYNPDTDVVAPHGILGQAYDQDNLAVDGKIDEEKTGESTTTAQAEGAIEGSWEDYIVSSKFSTDFKYSRFGLAKAAPRDVSKLTGTKKAMEEGAVGASDQQ